jgi:hypothetical protein
MRSDMHKVIVERPRRLGSSGKNRKTALRLSVSERAKAITDADDYDSGHPRASSARHEKQLNENLAPLKRYLMGQVGRPWDKVYSEILPDHRYQIRDRAARSAACGRLHRRRHVYGKWPGVGTQSALVYGGSWVVCTPRDGNHPAHEEPPIDRS